MAGTYPVNRVIGPTADVVLHVVGTGFNPESVIQFAGQPENTVFVSSREVTTIITGALFTGVDPAVPISVKNGELSSNTIYFAFQDPDADNALLVAVAPATVPRGGEITLTGSGFSVDHVVYTGSVQSGGVALETTFVSATTLRAKIPTDAPLGQIAISVCHLGPPVGGSQAKPVKVTEAA